ncbi:MAG TPA: lipid IV(A) 3-deoxy-D-manno-octulosonic acid transferase [Lysobacter sp.]|nr:lipid IV(A) 3-deoxy-D-manno-octulosonic acid transferase [Lysobacter sp.]
MRMDLIERLLRVLYSAALYLLAPITVYHLIWRGFRQPAYLQRWSERYARYRDAPHARTLWIHAVSVGEVNAALPLVQALRRGRPDLRLLVTTITPTGSERVRSLWKDEVEHVYLPYDLPGAVGRFLDHYRPIAALIMETELWPNLLFGCRDRNVPSYILNARLSARSLRGYQVLAPLIGRALRTVRTVSAQSHADARRFIKLGATAAQTLETGNLKYDVSVPDHLAQFAGECRTHCRGRPVWIAASTHEDEEAAVIGIHRRLLAQFPDLLLLWAPRHPERFRAVAEHARVAGWQVSTRSRAHWPQVGDAVFVIDTLGELMSFYACADATFVGGSLQAIGGHNLLEPAATGTAIVTGPHLHNFAEIAHKLEHAGALKIGADADGVGQNLAVLLGDREARTRMVTAGQALVETGRGALARTMALLEPVLTANP